MKNKVQLIFPDHFYVDGPYPLVPSEKNFIQSLKEETHVNIGNNLISKNTYILENENLKNLKNYFQQCINEYAYDYYKIDKKTEFYITQSWINFNEKGTQHHTHRHSNSVISGVFYVDGDEDCPIIFSRDDGRAYFGGSYEYDITEYNILNSRTWQMNNQKYHLILFPSTLSHTVKINSSDNERVSLSFNTFFKGTIGKEKQLTELKL